jgi:pimeloyl-ACP methyl ester carboxylesterase
MEVHAKGQFTEDDIMKSVARVSTLLCAVGASTITLPAAQLTTEPNPPYVEMIQLPPDPCLSHQVQLNPAPWPSQDFDVLGRPMRLFAAGPSSNPGDPPLRHDPSRRPLVLVIDGNGFGLEDYDDLAGYLALKGFNVAVIDRVPNGLDPVDYALAAIDAAFAELGLPSGAPVGLIGHSMGGSIAIDTIIENHGNASGFEIGALVLLAPKVSDGIGTLLNPDHVPALLAVYGSQDNDVAGLSNELTDAFSAYDRSGTESSTTCHQPFCAFQPQMHRTMVYIHGADHAGLVNRTPQIGADPFNNYLSKSNQFCIAKGYTMAMLEWALDGNSQWKSMVHGGHVPASIQGMKTAAPDELGNPAGSPLRLALQVSPKKRSVIENFEDGAWSIASQTPHVLTQTAVEGQWAGGDRNVRHATKIGVVAWPDLGEWQLLGVQVPAGRRNVTGFTHVALRLGQLTAVGDPAVENPPNTYAPVMIGLVDGSSSSWWVWADAYGGIPPADQRPNGQPQSVMNTLRIPLSAFSSIDKSDIEGVYLAFPSGTQGTLLIDSVEWFKE